MTFHLISGAVMGLCALYLCARHVLPLRVGMVFKALACMLIFLCAFKLQVLRAVFPGEVMPEIAPQWLVISGWAFSVVIMWTVLSLVWDFCILLRTLFVRSRSTFRTRRTPRHGVRVGVLLASALILSTVSVVQGVRVPPVKKVDIYIDNLPPALWNFRIVQLSDLHVSPLFRENWVRAVVERANALHPDLMVLTGDLIDGSTSARAKDVAPLADLRARYGVYGCLGNHEYYAGLESWIPMFARLGIRMLVNNHAVLPVSAQQGRPEQGAPARAALVLGGVADPSGAARTGAVAPDMEKVFADSPRPAGDVWRLLLAHQPRLADEAARHGVGLQLSGHTHGGQLFPLSLTVGKFNGGYLANLYTVNGMVLYVSRGVGLWGGFPVRLGAPSEITEITLRPRDVERAVPAR